MMTWSGSGDRTVGTELQRLMPFGSVQREDDADLDWSEPPDFPVDLFAAVGGLLYASGVYQYIAAPLTTSR